MSAHTPGPWRIDGRDVISTDWPVARTFGATLEQQQANARLIAAAPELLLALASLLTRYSTLVNSGDCGSWNPENELEVMAARQAIAKAESHG